MLNVAFIGSGNMACAIARGMISSQIISPCNITLFDKNSEQYSRFHNDCRKATSILDAVSQANYIFLSVKPQNIAEVLEEIAKNKDLSSKIFISICAGITMSSIEARLGEIKIARAMPNTPLLIGQGVTGLCQNNRLELYEFDTIKSFFNSCGFTVEVNESDLNNVTALTGSSPAYAYLFVKSAVDAIKKLGFNNEKSTEMFCKTLIGASNMILQSNKSIDDLIKMVTSPNGTTEKAMISFEENNFSEIMYKAMKACADKAEELSKLN